MATSYSTWAPGHLGLLHSPRVSSSQHFQCGSLLSTRDLAPELHCCSASSIFKLGEDKRKEAELEHKKRRVMDKCRGRQNRDLSSLSQIPVVISNRPLPSLLTHVHTHMHAHDHSTLSSASPAHPLCQLEAWKPLLPLLGDHSSQPPTWVTFNDSSSAAASGKTLLTH